MARLPTHVALAAFLMVGAACSNPTGEGGGGARDMAGVLSVRVDSLPAGMKAGLHVLAPDGIERYAAVGEGTTTLIPGAAFGSYSVSSDTVWTEDTGIVSLKYDASRWVATPRSYSLGLSATHSRGTLTFVYRQVTGGIAVSASGNPELWVEFLHADGTGCRCTAFGFNGIRDSANGASVQNLLPGEYQVHFLPISYAPQPGRPGERYVMIPSPEVVWVTVRPREIAKAATLYQRQ